MTGLRYSPLHMTEFCGEMQGKFKVGLVRLINKLKIIAGADYVWEKSHTKTRLTGTVVQKLTR